MPINAKFTKEQVIDAIKRSRGFISQAAKILKCAVPTIYNYKERYPEVEEAIKNERESLLDFAEGKLLENINNNDNAAIIFFLKTQGKHRGYSEKEQITIKNDFTNFQIPKNLDNLTYIENNSEHTK
jgi:sugar-specific transcriptional regulator TrmB